MGTSLACGAVAPWPQVMARRVGGDWRGVIEGDVVAHARDAQLVPHRVQIDHVRLRAHVAVKSCEHLAAGGAVADLERLRQRPILVDVSTGIQNRARAFVEALLFASRGWLDQPLLDDVLSKPEFRSYR